jgi:hypothetical protein
MTYRFTVLDSRATQYVDGCLRKSNCLGVLVVARKDLRNGETLGLLPEGTRDSAYNFESGFHSDRIGSIDSSGSYVQRVQSTEDEAARWLGARLAEDHTLLFVAESYLLRPSDLQLVPNASTTTVASNEFVYYLAWGAPQTKEALSLVYERPLGVSVIAKLGCDAAEWVAGRHHLEDSDLEHLADCTIAVLVGGYDGESILLWTSVDWRPVENL